MSYSSQVAQTHAVQKKFYLHPLKSSHLEHADLLNFTEEHTTSSSSIANAHFHIPNTEWLFSKSNLQAQIMSDNCSNLCSVKKSDANFSVWKKPLLQEQETVLSSSASSIFIADNVNLFLKLQTQLLQSNAHINDNVLARNVVIKMFFLAETSFTQITQCAAPPLSWPWKWHIMGYLETCS